MFKLFLSPHVIWSIIQVVFDGSCNHFVSPHVVISQKAEIFAMEVCDACRYKDRDTQLKSEWPGIYLTEF
jgi:hypothetical protein